MDARYYPSRNAVSSAILMMSIMLHGCGGGSGTGLPATNSNEHVQVEVLTSVPSPPPVNVVATTPELPLVDTEVTPGWVASAGVSLANTTSIGSWSFTSQKSTTWVPGAMSISTVDASDHIALDYDFGCSTPVIRVRDTDCRNVVSLTSSVASSIPVTARGAIALTVRNVDAGAEFALRLKDSTGQTLQYPIQIRSIQNQDPSQWVNARISLRFPSIFWGGGGATTPGVPSGTISSVSIVAAPRNSDSGFLGLNYPKGRLEIKSVAYLENSTLAYRLQSSAPINSVGAIPSLDGRLAVAHNSFDLNQLRKAKDAGFTVIRRGLYWSGVERNGAFSYNTFASGIENISALSMKVLWILAYGHPDHGGEVPLTSEDRAAFAKFSRESAAFFRDYPVKGFEVWNEPNMPGYWPNPDADAYGQMLVSATAAIRTVDSTVPVISAGVAIDELSYLFKLAKNGYLSQVSGVGVHPYRKDFYVTQSPSFKRTFSTPEMYANDRLITKKILAAQGVNKPVWNTESGYSSVFFLDPNQYPDAHSDAARNRQGQLLLRHVLSQVALNEPLITIYRLADTANSTTDKEENFGLLDSTGGEKPAYAALKNFTNVTSKLNYKGVLLDTPPGVHGLRWEGISQKVVCLWVESLGEEVTVTIPQDVKRIVGWSGADLSKGATIQLTESTGPVYFIF